MSHDVTKMIYSIKMSQRTCFDAIRHCLFVSTYVSKFVTMLLFVSQTVTILNLPLTIMQFNYRVNF